MELFADICVHRCLEISRSPGMVPKLRRLETVGARGETGHKIHSRGVCHVVQSQLSCLDLVGVLSPVADFGFPLNTLCPQCSLWPHLPAVSFAPERCAGHGGELSHYRNGRLEAFIRVILMPLIKYLRFR